MRSPNRWGSGIRAAAPLLLVIFATGAVFRATRRFTRYEVTGDSMRPALRPGDWLIVDRAAYRTHPPRAGDIVIARDPRDGRAIVKRVASATGAGLELRGDNAARSTDGRTFGLVDRASVLGRVEFRYWPWTRSPRSP